MSGAKLYVLGGSGFLGRYFCNEAIENGFDVTVIGRHSTEWLNDNKYISFIKVKDYFTYDFSKLCNESDILINFAAIRGSKSFSLSDYLTNISLVKKCIEVCEMVGTKLVHISSMSVYNRGEGLEEEICHPISLYGESKLASDLLIDYLVNNENINIVSLRAAQVIGWGERKGYVLNSFIENAANKEPLILYGEGKSRRQYIYAKDLVDAILFSIKHDLKGIYNIGISQNISISELAIIINEIYNNEASIKYVEYCNEDSRNDSMSMMKITNAGWKPRYSVKEAIADMRVDREKGYFGI